MSFREDNKEWFLWTLRDEIYGFFREYLKPIVVTLVVSFAGAIWAFAKQHPMVWLPIVSVAATLAVITVLALRDGRSRRANAQSLTDEKETKIAKKPITLRTLFETDFPNLDHFENVLRIKKSSANEKECEIPFRLCVDFDARSRFLAFYVGVQWETRRMCVSIAKNYKDAIQIANQSHVYSMRPPNTAETQLREVVFTGRIFIYHEYEMTQREKAELEDFYKLNGAAVQFLGPVHLALNAKGGGVQRL